MVRAGAVNHPSEWEYCGCDEIQKPPERYGVIDLMRLQHLCGFSDSERFAAQHRQSVSDAIINGTNRRDNCWTESIAVGSAGFVEETKGKLGIKAIGRRVEEQNEDMYVLREESAAYNTVFDQQKGLLSPANSYFGILVLVN